VCVSSINYLDRRRVQRVVMQIEQETRQTAAALAAHRIFLVGHGRRAHLALLERFLQLVVGLKPFNLPNVILNGLNSAGLKYL